MAAIAGRHIKLLVVLAGLAYIVLFHYGWHYLYEYSMDPEPQRMIPLSDEGDRLAAAYGWRYVQVNDVLLGREYYSAGPKSRQNWDVIAARINDSAMAGGPALLSTFCDEGYGYGIVQQYWFGQSRNGALVVGEIVDPGNTYAVPETLWGPANYFSFRWNFNVTDRGIIFTKPSREQLSAPFKFYEFFAFLALTVGGVIAFFLLSFVGVVLWLLWYGSERKQRYTNSREK